MKHYWAVRLGEGGKYLQDGLKGNFIAVGWNELGDLAWLANLNIDSDKAWDKAWQELKQYYEDKYGKESEVKTGINVGQVMKFVQGIHNGEIVLTPDSFARQVHIAVVTSPYRYSADWADGCPYPHRRLVNWVKCVDRDSLPSKLRFAMGSLLTIFNLDAYKEQIEAILTGTQIKPSEKDIAGPQLSDAILDKLYAMEPKEFEDFLVNLLKTIGFEASATQYVGDKGVDIIGSLNAEGLAKINLRVQVKKIGGTIGIDEVLKIRGTLAQEDQGAIITISKFTKQASEEAQATGKKPIALLEGKDLVELILQHYEELDLKYQELLGLKKKQIPLTDRFYMPSTGLKSE